MAQLTSLSQLQPNQTVLTYQYSGSIQSFTVPAGFSGQVDVYLWGGGGGGGGNDSHPGGCGAGGNFVYNSIQINAGDVIELLVGQGGQAGASGATGYGGGAGGLSFTNTSNYSFNGGNGGDAGPVGSSGAGGGGGGATVVLINGTPRVIGGGGGGGGGGGNFSNGIDSIGQGSSYVAAYQEAQQGQDRSDDGGGGGGGGGGYPGGDGGTTNTGDTGANPGTSGSSFGGFSAPGYTSDGNGRTPGGIESPLYAQGVALGGINTTSGGNGLAVLVMTFTGMGSIKVNGAWEQIESMSVKVNGTWTPVTSAFIKVNGSWEGISQPALVSVYSQSASVGTDQSVIRPNPPAAIYSVNATYYDGYSDEGGDDGDGGD
jgi:hypothetical protein